MEGLLWACSSHKTLSIRDHMHPHISTRFPTPRSHLGVLVRQAVPDEEVHGRRDLLVPQHCSTGGQTSSSTQSRSNRRVGVGRDQLQQAGEGTGFQGLGNRVWLTLNHMVNSLGHQSCTGHL